MTLNDLGFLNGDRARTRPRNRFRPEPCRPVRLMPRDLDLLTEVFLSRLITGEQMMGLGYFSSIPRTNARCRLLYDHGLLLRHRLPLSASTGAILYSLGLGAAPYVAARLEWDVDEVRRLCRSEFPSLSAEHTLRIVDVRIAFQHACNATGRQMQWRPELMCQHAYAVRYAHQTALSRQVFKPDGYLRLSPQTANDQPLHFFLEICMGHTSERRWAEKLQAFQQYMAAGLFAQRYKAQSYSVLIVTTSRRRAEHLCALTAENATPISLVTTFDQLQESGAFSKIWLRTGVSELLSLAEAVGITER